jgi:hypothetical protein
VNSSARVEYAVHKERNKGNKCVEMNRGTNGSSPPNARHLATNEDETKTLAGVGEERENERAPSAEDDVRLRRMKKKSIGWGECRDHRSSARVFLLLFTYLPLCCS